MKRLTYILTLLVLCSLPVRASITRKYTDHSVLEQGAWVKIAVDQTGVYRLSYEQLAAMGLNPEQVRIYGYGGEMLPQEFSAQFIDDLPKVAIYMEKGTDGVFGPGDYILFHARGPIGWEYQRNTTKPRFAHTRNPYSFYGYYFLTSSTGEQKLMPTVAALPSSGATEVTTFSDYRLHETEAVNLIDPTNGKTGGGREFYGEQFSAGTSRNIAFTFHDRTSASMRLYGEVAAKSSSASAFTVHGNRDSISAIPTGDFYTMAISRICDHTITPSTGNTQSIRLTFNGASSAQGFLNYIELTAQSQLTMKGGWFAFRNTTNAATSKPVTYRISNASASVQIWDVTYPDSTFRVPTTMEGTDLLFVGRNRDKVHEYVAVDPSAGTFLTPSVVSGLTYYAQNLHGLRDQDMVIITPDVFYSAAEQLAQAHRQLYGETVAVVTAEQVYNEFSSGTPDATAYRRLMKMLHYRGEQGGKKPSALLLFGRGTFDNRKILANSGDNMLLTYQAKNSLVETKAYATDDYFAFMGDEFGKADEDAVGVMAFGVGRLPARSTEEAEVMVNKTIAYMQDNGMGKWKSQLLFLADDGDQNQHTQTADAAAELVRKHNPNYVVTKLYLDAFAQESSASGESYPQAKVKFDQMMKDGVLFFDYSGHGSAYNITSEKMLSSIDIQNHRSAHQGFWALATCSFSHFDTYDRCSAERALLNPYGGAIGVFSATRTVYATSNTITNKYFCDTLFSHPDRYTYPMTVGEAARCAKNRSGGTENKLAYVLLGDPGLRLNYPCHYSVEVTQVRDTLHALDIDTIRGFIRTPAGDTAKMNGTVYFTIYDKIQTIVTKDNDSEEGKKVPFSYLDYPNVLLNGSGTVDSGLFRIPFLVPKDIHYNYGNGRMAFYAMGQVDEKNSDALGYYQDFRVGGTAKTWINDNRGPDLQIYLNTPLFVNGDKTYERPYFYARIEDENGINTAGTGIGHDLMLTVDNDTKQTYTMNSYFTADKDSYKAGLVQYHFGELAEGSHTLRFRAWDLLNNSSTATLDFQIVKSLEPQLYSVVAAPNPVQMGGNLTWYMNFDRQLEQCTWHLYLYNHAGEMVWERERSTDEPITLYTGETNLMPGIYLYRVRVKGADTDYSDVEGKIIIN